jgi:tetratricopeptide (TPR) repeat protein
MAVLAATIAALAVLSLVLAGVARLLTDRDGAARTGADLPRLAWAARVDPLSADPPLVRAIVARRAGRPDVALRALREAGRREPGRWLVPFELGLLHAAQGRRGLAVAQLDRAFALNPAQPVIQTARRQVVTGRRVDPDAVEDLLSPVARPAETRVLEDVRPSSYRLPAYNAGSRDR